MKIIDVIRNFFISSAGQLINAIYPIIVAKIIISNCGIDAFASLGVTLSILNILSLIIDYGSFLIGVKEVSINKENKDYLSKYLSTIYSFRIVILIPTLILYFSYIYAFVEDKTIYYYSTLFFVSQLINPTWIYQGLEKFKQINVIILVSKLFYLLFTFLFTKDEDSYVYNILILALSNLFIYVVYFYKVSKIYDISIKKTSLKLIYKNAKDDFYIFINNLSISYYVNIPIVLVNYFIGPSAAGIYKIVDMILSLSRSYLFVYFNVTYPRFCSIYKLDVLKSIKFLKTINSIHVLTLFVGVVLAYFLMPYMIYFFVSENTDVRIVNTARYLIFIPIIIALNIPFYQFLLVKNLKMKIALLSFSGAILLSIIGVLFIKYFQFNGVLYSIYVSEIFITMGMILIALNYKRKDVVYSALKSDF